MSYDHQLVGSLWSIKQYHRPSKTSTRREIRNKAAGWNERVKTKLRRQKDRKIGERGREKDRRKRIRKIERKRKRDKKEDRKTGRKGEKWGGRMREKEE